MNNEPTMVPIHATFQLFATLVTAATLAFYVSQMRAGHHGDWEPIYVSFVEFVAYLGALVFPPGYAFVVFGSVTIPLFRYVSWLTTCPIILKVLVSVISPQNMVDYDLVVRLMLTITWVELLGFMGAMYTGTAKVCCIIGSVIVCVYMYYCICAKWNKSCQVNMKFRKERFELLALLMVSWTLFPILYIIGPECFGLISNPVSIIGHVIGDIISKNLWGLLAWKLRLRLLALKDHQEVASNVDELSNPESFSKESETKLSFRSVNSPSEVKLFSGVKPSVSPVNQKHVHNFLLQQYIQSLDNKRNTVAAYEEQKPSSPIVVDGPLSRTPSREVKREDMQDSEDENARGFA